MRDIKFRAWDTRQQVMSSPVSLERLWVGERPKTMEDLVFLQHTGLKDKNGVEIYEGDIVSGRSYGQYKEQGIVTYGEYEYGEGADRYKNIGWYLSHGKYQHPLAMINVNFYDSWAKAKVIGNIWENEDLLK